MEAVEELYVMHLAEGEDEEGCVFPGVSLPWAMEDQWDEITGKELDKEKVFKGRVKELAKFAERRVYVHHPRDQAMLDEGGKFVRTRWVQTVKGDEVRCRLVAQEFAHGDPREDLFAGTPPLFAARLLVSQAASRPQKDWTLMCLDVSCAFLYAPIKRKIYIELPSEDPRSASGEWVGKLEKALYGTRDAPQAWLEELGTTLDNLGFKASAYFPGLYHHEGLQVTMVTHVDDLLCCGPPEALRRVRTELQQKYEVKGEVMEQEVQELRFLGRVITRSEEGFCWQEDPKHRQILLEEWGMSECNGVGTPIAVEKEIMEEEEMPPTEAKMFRRTAARLNYLAQDRPDLAVAANLLARSMSRPMKNDSIKVKRVLRYLQSHPSCKLMYAYQGPPQGLTILTDSDWAGDATTRRSTSGLMVIMGGHLIHFASRMQKTVALSSGEAELNALVLGLSEGLGISNVLKEWGSPSSIGCFCDSSAARGIASRVGVGRIKHLEVRQLWIQEQIRRGRAYIEWLPRKSNSADALTHACTEEQGKVHLARVGVQVVRIEAKASIRGGVLADPVYSWWAAPPRRCRWVDLVDL